MGKLIIYLSLFNDDDCNSDNVASNYWMMVNNELEGMWKVVIMA
jgi:hypothetical protein